jgi:hypothetical protein
MTQNAPMFLLIRRGQHDTHDVTGAFEQHDPRIRGPLLEGEFLVRMPGWLTVVEQPTRKGG